MSSKTLKDHPELQDSLDGVEADEELAQDKKDLGHWLDIAAALVPAEVLGVHALLMAFASETTVMNGDPGTTIPEPGVVSVLFFVLVVLAGFLFLASAGIKSLANWARAALVALAFVGWTMLQKDTAFDALKIHFNPDWLRPVLAVIGVVVVAALVKVLAGVADEEDG